MQTLGEKLAEMAKTEAYPTVDDWRLLVDDNIELAQSIVLELNAVLKGAIEFAKSPMLKTYSQIAEEVFPKLEHLEQKYQVGILDSEGYQAVA
ncbi:hypothetical protein, partial [Pseudomonas syringae]